MNSANAMKSPLNSIVRAGQYAVAHPIKTVRNIAGIGATAFALTACNGSIPVKESGNNATKHPVNSSLQALGNQIIQHCRKEFEKGRGSLLDDGRKRFGITSEDGNASLNCYKDAGNSNRIQYANLEIMHTDNVRDALAKVGINEKAPGEPGNPFYSLKFNQCGPHAYPAELADKGGLWSYSKEKGFREGQGANLYTVNKPGCGTDAVTISDKPYVGTTPEQAVEYINSELQPLLLDITNK